MPKWFQKRPKMTPKWSPKWPQNRPRGGTWTDSGFARVLRDFGVNLNSRPGAQNGAKNDIKNALKKLPPEHVKISEKLKLKFSKNRAIRE